MFQLAPSVTYSRTWNSKFRRSFRSSSWPNPANTTTTSAPTASGRQWSRSIVVIGGPPRRQGAATAEVCAAAPAPSAIPPEEPLRADEQHEHEQDQPDHLAVGASDEEYAGRLRQ